MFKICYIADARQRHTIAWVDFFKSRGYEVHLISPEPPRLSDMPDIQVHLLSKFPFRIKFISYPLDLLFYAIGIKKLIKKIRPQILHGHYIIECGFWSALSGFHPLILSAWGSDILVWPNKSRIFRFIAQYSMNRADLITTTTEEMRKYILERYKVRSEKVKLLSWGPNFDIFRVGYNEEGKIIRKSLNMPDSDFVILSPRNMTELYGIETIILSMPFIIKKYPKVCLVLLEGNVDSYYKESLKKIVENLSITKYVRFISQYLTPYQMAAYYNISDVFVSIPSTDQLGVTILEGMMCGSAPILSKLKVYEQYFTQDRNALFVVRENPQDIAKNIMYYIENPEIKNKFFMSNKNIIEERWNWQKNAPIMEKAYINLVKRGQNGLEDSVI
ncbi:MAG: glycosyltransferase family 4 protein [Eubacteriales bacterium]